MDTSKIKNEFSKENLKKHLYDYAIVFVGAFLYSMAVATFIVPNKIGTAGVVGIALSVRKFFPNMPIGLFTICINIPLFIAGLKIVGKRFAAKSVFYIIVSNIMIDFFAVHPITSFRTDDMFLATVFAGVISGVAIAFVFAVGGSGGGLDITAKIIVHRNQDLNLSKVLLIQDIIVYIVVGFCLGPISVMYAVVMSYIRSISIDTIQSGLSSMRQCMIICDTHTVDKIVHEVFDQLGRGATVFDGKGAYTETEKKILYVVVLKNETTILRNIVRSVDKTAFLTTTNVNSLSGNFIKKGRWNTN